MTGSDCDDVAWDENVAPPCWKKPAVERRFVISFLHLQVAEREHQRIKATRMIAMLKQIKQEDESVIHKFSLSNMMSRATR